MLVKDAKDTARQWVQEEGSKAPDFCGAFIAGSTNWMADDAPLPPGSDVDIKVVLDSPTVAEGPQKIPYRDVILDISYAPRDGLRSAEAVLGNYYIAGHFTGASIVADPLGQLCAIQPKVAQEYARRTWVRARCEHAQAWQREYIPSWRETAPIHDHVLALLLATCVAPHALLVANLQNPTIRKSLVASRTVLEPYGRLAMQDKLINILGSASMARAQVEVHLASCLDAFDAASGVASTPYFGSTMIREFARPLVVHGARDLIDRGLQREAMLWIAIIHSWSQKSLDLDAPREVRARYTPAYMHLLAELGVETPSDIERRRAQIRELHQKIWEVTEEILAANPAIRD